MGKFKYLFVLTIPVTVAIAFSITGVWTFLPLLYAFGAVPLLELVLPPSAANADGDLFAQRQRDRFFDFALLICVPIQLFFLGWFLISVNEVGLSWVTRMGRVTAFGLMCGVLAINVAHELGHRPDKLHQQLAKVLLTTSLYTHFFIEHNRGHHRNVSTPEDPASARFGEHLYAFWLRSLWGSYAGAWQLERTRLERKKLAVWTINNEMVQYTLVQILLLGFVLVFFGGFVLMQFLVAAVLGMLLLETVNYIEHYGLARKKLNAQRYENATPIHSWNSNHLVGRALLFELSRHSDHHAHPNREYQILRHHEVSPQMPTGYPGMMLLAAVPPLWFAVMHPRIPSAHPA